jgi:hypothetical protein
MERALEIGYAMFDELTEAEKHGAKDIEQIYNSLFELYKNDSECLCILTMCIRRKWWLARNYLCNKQYEDLYLSLWQKLNIILIDKEC